MALAFAKPRGLGIPTRRATQLAFQPIRHSFPHPPRTLFNHLRATRSSTVLAPPSACPPIPTSIDPPNCVDTGIYTQSGIYAQAEMQEPCGDLIQPWLTDVQAHASSLTAGVLIDDPTKDGKLFVSASMDKTVAAWRWKLDEPLLRSDDDEGVECDEGENAVCSPYVEVQKIVVPGGPLFSLVQAQHPDQSGSSDRTPAASIVFGGNAAKEVVAWEPFSKEFMEMKLGDHTGWVRSLAKSGKFLFSVGCNFLRMWDTTYAVPKEVSFTRLFTGDILAVTADKESVYTAGADGSLHSWTITDTKTGQLEEMVSVMDAHEGRVSSVLLHEDWLFSCDSEGSIKAWDKKTLQLVGELEGAHSGEKIHCMAMAPGGLLFSGGDDHMIRAWDTATLSRGEAFGPANYCQLPPFHQGPVRMLVADEDCLVSGDSDGRVSIWRYGPAVQQAVQALVDLKAVEAMALEAAMQDEDEEELFSDCLSGTSSGEEDNVPELGQLEALGGEGEVEGGVLGGEGEMEGRGELEQQVVTSVGELQVFKGELEQQVVTSVGELQVFKGELEQQVVTSVGELQVFKGELEHETVMSEARFWRQLGVGGEGGKN